MGFVGCHDPDQGGGTWAVCDSLPNLSACITSMNEVDCTTQSGAGCTDEGVPVVSAGVENSVGVRITGNNFSPWEGFFSREVSVGAAGSLVTRTRSTSFFLSSFPSSHELNLFINYELDSSAQGIQNISVAMSIGTDQKIVPISGYCASPDDDQDRTVPVVVGSALDLAIADILIDPSSPGYIGTAANGTALLRAPGTLYQQASAIHWKVKLQGANLASANAPSVTLRTQADGNCSPGGNPSAEQCNVTVSLAALRAARGQLTYPLFNPNSPLIHSYTDSFRPGSLGISSEGINARINGLGGLPLTVDETSFANNVLGVPTALLPTLYLSKAILTQAVNNFTLDPGADLLADLVLGKSSILLLDVSMDGPSGPLPPISAQVPVAILVRTSDQSPPFSRQTSIGEISLAPRSGRFPFQPTLTVTSPVFRPQTAGTFQILVQASVNGVIYDLPLPTRGGSLVLPGLQPGLSANTFRVKQTNPIRIAAIPLDLPGSGERNPCIDSCQCGSTNRTIYGDALRKNGIALPPQAQFLQDIYPIADGALSLTDSGGVFNGFSVPSTILGDPEPTLEAAHRDIINLELNAIAMQVSRIAAGVPFLYFRCHKIDGLLDDDSLGASKSKLTPKVVLVAMEDRNTTAYNTLAHEVGHTLSLPESFIGTSPPEGFNPRIPAPVLASHDLMHFFVPGGSYWIGPASYLGLFRELQNPIKDPELLAVTGILRRDGSLSLGPWMYFAQGDLTEDQGGNLLIRTMDKSGAVLSQVSLDPEFTIHVDSRGVIPVNSVPFVLTVPASASLASVQISNAGTVLISASPASKSLSDAVQNLPDAAFTKDPDNRRKALLNKISALDGMIARGARQSAHEKLQHDIKDKVGSWLVNDYEKTSILQFKKGELLELIDRILGTL